MRSRRKDAAFLASRGLAHQARGESDLAIADAEAALRTGERPFWALEVRGLAELGKGQQAAGEADPRLAEHVRKLGFGLAATPAPAAAR